MKKLLIPAAFLLLAAASCKKEDEGGTAGWSSFTYGLNLSALYSPLSPAEQAFNLNTAFADTIITSGGIRFIIPERSFVAQNSVVPTGGNVRVKIHEYFTNTALLSGGIGTTTVEGRLLLTGGAFNIIVSDSNGTEQQLIRGIDVTVPDNGRFNSSHRLFVRRYVNTLVPTGITDPNIVNWGRDSMEWKRGQHGSNTTYDFSIYRLNWWNLDHYADQGQGMTTLSVTLPETYGNTNSVVVLLAPENGLMRLYGDNATKTFTTGNGYSLPIGMPVKVLAIGRKGSQYSYALRPLTITADQTLSIPALQDISEQGLRDVIMNELN